MPSVTVLSGIIANNLLPVDPAGLDKMARLKTSNICSYAVMIIIVIHGKIQILL